MHYMENKLYTTFLHRLGNPAQVIFAPDPLMIKLVYPNVIKKRNKKVFRSYLLPPPSVMTR